MEARIIGLKACGKTTLVSALAEGRGEGHVATVHVGDPRVRTLSEIFQPKKTTFAEFRVQEVAWPEASARQGRDGAISRRFGRRPAVHTLLRAFDSAVLGEPAHPEPIWKSWTGSSCCSTSYASSGPSSAQRRRRCPTRARRPCPGARKPWRPIFRCERRTSTKASSRSYAAINS